MLPFIPDIYSDNHKTLSNLYCQLYMLKTTSPILRETIFQDSIILSVRDDLYFPDISSLTKALDLSMHLRQKPFFLTSCFHWHSGINDRFFISDARTALKLFNRLDNMTSLYSSSIATSAEVILFSSLPRPLLLLSSPIKHLRVRSNLRFKREHYFYPFHRPFELARVIYSRIVYIF